jgi:hypothetical protein
MCSVSSLKAEEQADFIQLAPGSGFTFEGRLPGNTGTIELIFAVTEDMKPIPATKTANAITPGQQRMCILSNASDRATRLAVLIRGDRKAIGLSDGVTIDWIATPVIADGEYHHLALSTLGSMTSVYIDEKYVGYLLVGYGPDQKFPWHVGERWAGVEPFTGFLATVRIWNRALDHTDLLDCLSFSLPDGSKIDLNDLVAMSRFTDESKTVLTLHPQFNSLTTIGTSTGAKDSVTKLLPRSGRLTGLKVRWTESSAQSGPKPSRILDIEPLYQSMSFAGAVSGAPTSPTSDYYVQEKKLLATYQKMLWTAVMHDLAQLPLAIGSKSRLILTTTPPAKADVAKPGTTAPAAPAEPATAERIKPTIANAPSKPGGLPSALALPFRAVTNNELAPFTPTEAELNRGKPVTKPAPSSPVSTPNGLTPEQKDLASALFSKPAIRDKLAATKDMLGLPDDRLNELEQYLNSIQPNPSSEPISADLKVVLTDPAVVRFRMSLRRYLVMNRPLVFTTVDPVIWGALSRADAEIATTLYGQAVAHDFQQLILWYDNAKNPSPPIRQSYQKFRGLAFQKATAIGASQVIGQNIAEMDKLDEIIEKLIDATTRETRAVKAPAPVAKPTDPPAKPTDPGGKVVTPATKTDDEKPVAKPSALAQTNPTEFLNALRSSAKQYRASLKRLQVPVVPVAPVPTEVKEQTLSLQSGDVRNGLAMLTGTRTTCLNTLLHVTTESMPTSKAGTVDGVTPIRQTLDLTSRIAGIRQYVTDEGVIGFDIITDTLPSNEKPPAWSANHVLLPPSIDVGRFVQVGTQAPVRNDSLVVALAGNDKGLSGSDPINARQQRLSKHLIGKKSGKVQPHANYTTFTVYNLWLSYEGKPILAIEDLNQDSDRQFQTIAFTPDPGDPLLFQSVGWELRRNLDATFTLTNTSTKTSTRLQRPPAADNTADPGDKLPWGATFSADHRPVLSEFNMQGYNLLTMNPRNYQLGTGSSKKVFEWPAEGSTDYQVTTVGKIIPRGLFFRADREGNGSVRSTVINSSQEHQEAWSVNAGVNAGVPGIGSFSLNGSYSNESKSMRSMEHGRTLSITQDVKHALVLDRSTMRLDADFYSRILRLRDLYLAGNLDTDDEYLALLKDYGTNYPYAVAYGGAAYQEVKYSKTDLSTMFGSGFSLEASGSADIFGISLGGSVGGSKSSSNTTGSGSMGSRDAIVTIGGELSQGGSWSIPDRTEVPILLDLRPLPELLSPVFFDDRAVWTHVREKLNQTLTAFCPQSENIQLSPKIVTVELLDLINNTASPQGVAEVETSILGISAAGFVRRTGRPGSFTDPKVTVDYWEPVAPHNAPNLGAPPLTGETVSRDNKTRWGITLNVANEQKTLPLFPARPPVLIPRKAPPAAYIYSMSEVTSRDELVARNQDHPGEFKVFSDKAAALNKAGLVTPQAPSSNSPAWFRGSILDATYLLQYYLPSFTTPTPLFGGLVEYPVFTLTRRTDDNAWLAKYMYSDVVSSPERSLNAFLLLNVAPGDRVKPLVGSGRKASSTSSITLNYDDEVEKELSILDGLLTLKVGTQLALVSSTMTLPTPVDQPVSLSFPAYPNEPASDFSTTKYRIQLSLSETLGINPSSRFQIVGVIDSNTGKPLPNVRIGSRLLQTIEGYVSTENELRPNTAPWPVKTSGDVVVFDWDPNQSLIEGTLLIRDTPPPTDRKELIKSLQLRVRIVQPLLVN